MRYEFNRWRISLKAVKWLIVLCCFFWVLARILQVVVLHYDNGNDVSAVALGIGFVLSQAVASVLFLLEETVDSIDGDELRKQENKVCGIIFIVSLLLFIILRIFKIPLIE